MLNTHLKNIQIELNKRHRPKNQLLESYVQLRLLKSLQTYYKEISNSSQYLLNRNPNNVLRSM